MSVECEPVSVCHALICTFKSSACVYLHGSATGDLLWDTDFFFLLEKSTQWNGLSPLIKPIRENQNWVAGKEACPIKPSHSDLIEDFVELVVSPFGRQLHLCQCKLPDLAPSSDWERTTGNTPPCKMFYPRGKTVLGSKWTVWISRGQLVFFVFVFWR
jgi:hypothetical protein